MSSPKYQRILETIEARGFDASYIVRGGVKVRCSQCEVLSINGVACHETGCPNRKHECNGCNAVIPFNQKYCADCQ